VANEVKLKIRISDDGDLELVGKKAKKASKNVDELGNATDRLSNKKNKYNKLEKGTAALGANSTKNFSKLNQTIGSGSSGLVGAYAVLAANVFALSAAFNFLKRSADLKILEESQKSFAQTTGLALTSVTAKLREASDGLLGFREASQAAAIGVAKGFSPKQLEDLAVGARKVSTALGRDFEDSFDRLIRGASKAEPELLDELGITLRLEEATKRYADTIGKSAGDLNTFERSQAVLIETQRQLNESFGEVEPGTNAFVRLQKTFEDILRNVTQNLLPIFEGFADVLNRSGGAAIAVFGLIALSITKTINPFNALAEKSEKWAEKTGESYDKAKRKADAYGRLVSKIDKEIVESSKKRVQELAKEAQKESKAAKGSKILSRVAEGATLTPQQKGQLKKMILDAEKQTLKSTKVMKGAFKNMTKEQLAEFKNAYKKMDAPRDNFFKRFGQQFKKVTLNAKLTAATIRRRLGGALVYGAKAARAFGNAMNKAMRLAGILGVIVTITQAIRKLAEAPATLSLKVAGMIDSIINMSAGLINTAVRSILGFVDTVSNGISSFTKGVKSLINDLVRGGFGKINNLINGIVDKVNDFIEKINDWTGKDIELIKFKSDLGAEFEGFDLAVEESKLEENFQGINREGTRMVDWLKNQSWFATAQAVEASSTAFKNSKDALEGFSTAAEAALVDIDAAIEGADKLRDRGMDARAEAVEARLIATVSLSSLLEKINKKVVNSEGEVTDEFVMNAGDRAAAIEEYMTVVSKLTSINPNYVQALKDQNTEEITRVETLSRLATAADEALRQANNFDNELLQTLSGGDIIAANAQLNSLIDSVTSGSGAFEELGDKKAALDLLERLNKVLNVEDYTKLQAKFEEIKTLSTQISMDTATQAGLKGKAAEFAQRELATNQALFELEMLRIQIAQTEVGPAQEALKIKEKQLEIALKLKQASQAAGDNAFLGAAGQAGVLAKANYSTFESGTSSEKIKALSESLSPITAMFESLGPEGEAIKSAIEGSFILAEAYTSAFEKMKDGSLTVSDGIQVASATVTQLGAIQAAQSKAAIAGIDQQIAAEKARDGKSADSIAKIAQLEKKKEAMQRKAFEIDKKMKMAQAVLATAQGVTNMLGAAPPPFNFALAGMVAAMGAAQLAIISGTSFQGGATQGGQKPSAVTLGNRQSSVDVARSQSVGGELAYFRGQGGMGSGAGDFKPSFMGGKYRAAGGETVGYTVGEQGPELFIPDRPGTIVPADDSANMMSGATNVSFSINAVDAEGVEEVLMAQRGNIIGMLRDAANSYGEPFMESINTNTFNKSRPGAYRR